MLVESAIHDAPERPPVDHLAAEQTSLGFELPIRAVGAILEDDPEAGQFVAALVSKFEVLFLAEMGTEADQQFHQGGGQPLGGSWHVQRSDAKQAQNLRQFPEDDDGGAERRQGTREGTRFWERRFQMLGVSEA